jgi:hypothetical protein
VALRQHLGAEQDAGLTAADAFELGVEFAAPANAVAVEAFEA